MIQITASMVIHLSQVHCLDLPCIFFQQNYQSRGVSQITLAQRFILILYPVLIFSSLSFQVSRLLFMPTLKQNPETSSHLFSTYCLSYYTSPLVQYTATHLVCVTIYLNTKYYFLLNTKEKCICGILHTSFHDTSRKRENQKVQMQKYLISTTSQGRLTKP